MTQPRGPRRWPRTPTALVAGGIITALIALVVPVAVLQARATELSHLETDLATTASLLALAEVAGHPDALTANLPKGTPVAGTAFSPDHTLTAFGSALGETLCVEGALARDNGVWSYDTADGGIQEGPCEARQPRWTPTRP